MDLERIVSPLVQYAPKRAGAGIMPPTRHPGRYELREFGTSNPLKTMFADV